MVVLSAIFLLIELIMLVYLINKIRKTKQISLKDTVIYPFLILVAALVMGTAHAKYMEHKLWFESVNYAFSQAINLLKLSVDNALLNALNKNNTFLLVDYMLLFGISALALFSLSLSLVKTLIKNFMRIKIFNREIDYIFGFNEDVKTYINNLTKEQRKKTCVVLKYTETGLYTAEKLYLDDNGIKCYILPYDTEKNFKKTVARLASSKNKKYYILGFLDTEKAIYDFTNYAQNYLRDNNLYGKNLQFVVFVSGGHTQFVRELIKGNPRGEVINSRGKTVKLADESRGNITAFDKHEILAYDLIWDNNFAKHFPKNLINDDCTVQDCDINLYVLGFGKVNQAVLKDILIETQFVTVNNGKLAPKRMNVIVYDKEKKIKNINLAYGLMKYDEKTFNSEKYFELPEGYTSQIHYKYDTDIGEINFINRIYDEIKERAKIKPQVNYFLISIGVDYENSLIAKRLKDSFALLGNDCTNTYFVRCQHAMRLPADEFVYYGDESEVLTYENVVADAVYKIAKMESCIYEDRPVTEDNIRLEWSTLSRIKQGSNLYSVASIPFKLSLLKFDDYSITEEEYFKRYDPENERKNYTYSEKLSSASDRFSARDVLAFSEHERWNAYQLSVGAVPMKIKNSLKVEKNPDGTVKAVFSNKSENEVYHLCITTSRGLNQYHDYVEKINKQYGLNETSDVITYDYDLMDNVMQHLHHLKNR